MGTHEICFGAKTTKFVPVVTSFVTLSAVMIMRLIICIFLSFMITETHFGILRKLYEVKTCYSLVEKSLNTLSAFFFVQAFIDLNSSPAEPDRPHICKESRSRSIGSQSDYLIQVAGTKSHT